MTKYCCFFGHRFLLMPEEIIPSLKEAIINLITNEHVDCFFVGEHGDFDKLAYNTVLKVQEDYPHINIILVASYARQIHGHGKAFNDFEYPVPPWTPYRYSIPARNKWVVVNSDYMICYVDVEYGGAYKAMKQALKAKKTVINLTTIMR